MAMSKAVVASDVGWAPEVICDEIDGFLVNPKEHDKYADRIVSLLKNKDLRRAVSLNAKKKVEGKFSGNSALISYIEYYNSL